MNRRRGWTNLLFVFGVGALAGVLGTWLYLADSRTDRWEQAPAAQRDEIMTHLARALSLTAAQQAEIAPIVMRIHLGVLKVRYAHQTEIEDILTRGIADLGTALSPDQQDELDEIYARIKDRWQQALTYLEDTKGRFSSKSYIR